MSRRNIALAKYALDKDETLEKIGRKFGVSRGRVWQVVRAFCLEQMLVYERLDSNGKLKDLNGLRLAWRRWARV